MIKQRFGHYITTKKGYELIKEFEGLELKSYDCPGGVKTIGYGHLIRDDENFKEPITKEKAEELLFYDIKDAEKIVNKYVKIRLTSNQFDALISFVYNLGEGNFRSSTLLRKINAGKEYEAAAEFIRWRYSNGKVLGGLVKRRLAEATLYLKP